MLNHLKITVPHIVGIVIGRLDCSRIAIINIDEVSGASDVYLWHFDPEQYLNEIISAGFEVIIVGIAADGLDESFLGARIDKEVVEKLKKVHEKTKIHIAAEGGEFETMVLSGPMFKKKLKIIDSEKIMENKFTGQLVVKEIKLE